MLKNKLQSNYTIITSIIMQILLFWYGISTAENMVAPEENTTPTQENLVTTEASSVEVLSLTDKKAYQDYSQILKDAGMTPAHFMALIEKGETPLAIIQLAKEVNSSPVNTMSPILLSIEKEALNSNSNGEGFLKEFARLEFLKKHGDWSQYVNFRNLLTGTKKPISVTLGDNVSQITKEIFSPKILTGQIAILEASSYPEIKTLFLKIGITPLQAEYLLEYEYGSGRSGPKKLYEFAKTLDKISPSARQAILHDITVKIKTVWGTKIIDHDSRLSWNDFKSLGQFQVFQVHLHGNYVEPIGPSISSKSEYGQWLQNHKHIVYPCAILTLGLCIGCFIYYKTK